MYQSLTLASLVLSASTAAASSMFTKRDSWGPAFSLGPAKQEIISTTTTIYPGKMPSNQPGYLFVWLGISNGTGDLIQSIIGSYPKGGSQCTGPNADTAWCVSSEVYGLASNGFPNQFIGELQTADTNYANGIRLTYTLADKATYLWTQTMEDAVTGTLLSSFNKTSGPMLGWGTALECQDYNGSPCKGTVEEQSYVNSTIVLAAADNSFVDTLGSGTGVTHTDMVSADGGKTWTIGKILIPAMTTETSSDSASGSVDTNANVAASSSVGASLELSTLAPSVSSATASVIPEVTSISKSACQATKSMVTMVSPTAKASACTKTGVPGTSSSASAQASASKSKKAKKPKKSKSTRAARPTASAAKL
ncbi:hypothetical protein BKA64DRAFT_658042 [Cadophora sp. MPI-SDFR-AT-0126]|nr:hypothetical protein BKA64DRAFT_658042 [Leotiomycetes sp. MPI-SDFR-AT-0126]